MENTNGGWGNGSIDDGLREIHRLADYRKIFLNSHSKQELLKLIEDIIEEADGRIIE